LDTDDSLTRLATEQHGLCARGEESFPDGELDMTKISVEVPAELLADLDEHVGEEKKFVNRSDAIRASIRKTLDLLDDIDERHGRLDDE
jgi:hypothetical protein